MFDKNVTRRSALITMGGLAAGTAPVTTARSDDDGPDSLREAGIEKPVLKLLHAGKEKQAMALADRHGVDYGYTKNVRYPSNGEVGTLDTVSKSPSYTELTTWNQGGGDHLFHMAFFIAMSGNDFDCGQPHDCFAISYSEDIFGTYPTTKKRKWHQPYYADSDNWASDQTNVHGYRTEWDDRILTDDWEGYIEIGAYERDSTASQATVYSDWIHTYSSGCVPDGVSFSLTGAGVLGISGELSTTVSWRLEDSEIHSL